MKPSQIPLELPVSSADSRDDLIVGTANRLAAELIDAWPGWPGAVVVMSGPPGSGKSHMARVWAKAAGASVIRMGDISPQTPPAAGHLIIEDAEPGEIDETALFHLLNHMRAENHHCLITSRYLPAEWNVMLPDLKSRLGAAQLVALQAPDDAMLRMIIVKLFADRQLGPDPGVIEYLVSRMERSLEAATRLVGEIDRESLARGKRITRVVAAAALENLDMG